MTTSSGSGRIRGETSYGAVYMTSPNASFEDVEVSLKAKILEHDWPSHGAQHLDGWSSPHAPKMVTKISSESSQVIKSIEPRLDEIEAKLSTAIDIGLQNRKLIEKLNELNGGESRVGLGAIHSLDQGRVLLTPPLVYGYQVVGDEVVASIGEFGVYGVGTTEDEAVEEVQDELWGLFEDLDRLPPEELGTQLVKTLRILRARIQRHAVDA